MVFPPRKHWLFLDADDTLLGVQRGDGVVSTHVVYNEARNTFAAFMASLGVPTQVALDREAAIQSNLNRQYGFGNRATFGTAFCDTYIDLCREYGIAVDWPILPSLRLMAEEVFRVTYAPLPGAMDFMIEMHSHFNLAIVTKGPEEEQRRKVFESRLFVYADQIFVYGFKDDLDWKACLNDLNLTREQRRASWAIGNSYPSDIRPPMSQGLNGILLDVETWSHEARGTHMPAPDQHFHTVDTISDAGLILRQHLNTPTS